MLHCLFFYKTKNNECKNGKNVNDDDDCAFVMRNETHFKEGVQLDHGIGITKHMTL